MLVTLHEQFTISNQMRQIELVTHDNVQCNCLCPYTMSQKDTSRYSSFIVSSKDIGKLHSYNQCCHACDAQCARDIEELCNVDMRYVERE